VSGLPGRAAERQRPCVAVDRDSKSEKVFFGKSDRDQRADVLDLLDIYILPAKCLGYVMLLIGKAPSMIGPPAPPGKYDAIMPSPWNMYSVAFNPTAIPILVWDSHPR
jgi:hypothetical protein